MQSNGRIVVGSSAQATNAVVAGFTSAGLDPTFGTDGITALAGSGGEATALGLADSIIGVGGTDASSSTSFVVRELTASGQLDTAFGSSGTVTTPASAFVAARARAMTAVQADGTVVVAGRTWTAAGGGDFFVARFVAPR